MFMIPIAFAQIAISPTSLKKQQLELKNGYFYRTRVRSLAMLVTTSLTDCRLGNLIDVVTVIDVDDEK